MAAIRVTRIAEPTEEIAELIGELNQELNALYLPEQRHGLALDAIFQPHIHFFIAHADNRAAGCGGVALFSDFAEVKRMFVRQTWRGGSVADAVMARLVEETRHADLNMLRLETGIHSVAAIRFYKRSGFEPCKIFEPYACLPPSSVATSVFMERRLP